MGLVDFVSMGRARNNRSEGTPPKPSQPEGAPGAPGTPKAGVVATMLPPAVGSGPQGLLTPGEQQQSRQYDITTGQNRFRDLMRNNPRVQEILSARKDMSQGLNAQEMTAAREQMVKGSQAANQGIMRSLLAQQQKSGIKGGLAAGQQMGMAQNFAKERADQERKLLLDNYAIKDKAFDKYQDASMGQVYGELAQGINEAGLGVADRTGYQQALIGQQMAAAAGQQPKKGFLGELLSGIF